jgi:hypothetical protein
VSTDFDAFSISLLDEAKRFLEKFGEDDEEAFLHASLVLGFSSLESHINSVSDELSLRHEASILDKSILLERAVKLKKGEWQLADTQYVRLEERMAFLCRRYGGKTLGSFSWWSDLSQGISARNDLVHPRTAVALQSADVKRFLLAIVSALNDLYLAVFGKGHPSFGRGLQSTMTF